MTSNADANEWLLMPASSFRVYPKRWVILLLFCTLSCSNNFQWIIFSPITHRVAEFFNCTNTDINWLPLIYNLVYVIGVFPVCSLYEALGLRGGMLVGGVINFIGAGIKVIGVWYPQFWLLVLAQLFSGAGQLFVLGLPAMVASIWFSEKERTLATATMTNASNLGIALGFLLSPLCVPVPTKDNMLLLFGHQTGVCGLVLLGIYLFVDPKPDTPPCATANMQAEPVAVGRALRALIKNKPFVLLSIAVGLGQSVFGGVCVVLTQILKPFGVSENEAGWIGFVGVQTGIIACVGFGIVIDRLRFYKMPLLMIFLGATATQSVLVVFLRSSENIETNNNVIASFVLICATQSLQAVTYPLAFEFVAELSYPAPESISGGGVMWVNNLLTFIVTLAMSEIIGNEPSVTLATSAFVVGIVATAVSGLLVMFVKEDRRRVAVEAAAVAALSVNKSPRDEGSV